MITEYRARRYRDPRTGQIVIAPLPAEVAAAGLVGPRLSAAIAFQKAACHMSYTTIQAFWRDLAGLDLSRGQLAKVARKVSAATDGRGPDVVVEATASAKLIGAATAFLRSRSRMVFLSWYPGHVEIDFSHFHNNAVIAYFPTGSGDMDTAREFLSALAAGEVVVGDNLTDIVPWRESCAAYQRLIAGDRSVLGMVVDWAGS